MEDSAMKNVNPQDPRTRRTRMLLQQSLGEMLTERSLASVTVADIARRAGVNRATFYAHFQDKDALLESALREKCRRVLQAALPELSPPTADAWRRLIEGVLDFFAAMPCRCPQAARLWNAIVVNAMREELDCLLQARLPEDSTPTLTAALSGAVVTVGLRWLRGQAAGTTAEAAAELTAFFVQGMPCNFFAPLVSQKEEKHTKARML